MTAYGAVPVPVIGLMFAAMFGLLPVSDGQSRKLSSHDADRVVHRALLKLKYMLSELKMLACSMNGRILAFIAEVRAVRRARRRDAEVDVVVVVDRQAKLLEIVGALDPPGGLAGRLHGGQQQRDQYGDDRDHHQ